MLQQLKSLFEDKCPLCNQKLQAKNDMACTTKTCPRGHYTEESYCSLGVTIVYDELK